MVIERLLYFFKLTSISIIYVLFFICFSTVNSEEEEVINGIEKPNIVAKKPINYSEAARNNVNTNSKTDRKKNLLDYADLLYKQKSYKLSSDKYLSFLKHFPNSNKNQHVLYFLSECYFALNNFKNAESIYLQVIEKYKSGNFVGNSAFRLATIYLRRNEEKKSIKYFRICVKNTKINKVRILALKKLSDILTNNDKFDEAEEILKKLINIKNDNPYREKSVISLSRLYLFNGRIKDTIRVCDEIISVTKNKEILAEALTISGDALLIDNKQREAYLRYQRTIKLGKIPEKLRSKARFGMILKSYEGKDWKNVINIFRGGVPELKDDQRAMMLLIVGKAYKNIEDCDNALELFNILQSYYPDTKYGRESYFRSLQCYYDDKNDLLPTFVDAYIEIQKGHNNNDSFIDLAYLLKGDFLFSTKKNYKSSAEAFEKIRLKNIDEKLHKKIKFRLGWSLALSKQYSKAISVLDEYMIEYPESEKIPDSLALIAMCNLQTYNYKKALEKYDIINKKYSNYPVAEIAYLNTAIIKGEKLNNNLDMVKILKLFIDKYPRSKFLSLANYKIGQGLVDQKKFVDAILFLQKARKNSPKIYFQKATYMLILCNFYLQKPLELMNLVDQYNEKRYPTQVPSEILAWLANELHLKRMDKRSEYYMSLILDKEYPQNVPAEYWYIYGLIKYNLAKYDESLEIFDIVIKDFPVTKLTSKVHLNKSKTALAQKKYFLAEIEAKKANKMVAEQRINAESSLLIGDIKFAQKKYNLALSEYAFVAITWDDPILTPRALYKMALTQKKLKNIEESKKTIKKVKKLYPEYEPEEDEIIGKIDNRKKINNKKESVL